MDLDIPSSRVNLWSHRTNTRQLGTSEHNFVIFFVFLNKSFIFCGSQFIVLQASATFHSPKTGASILFLTLLLLAESTSIQGSERIVWGRDMQFIGMRIRIHS